MILDNNQIILDFSKHFNSRFTSLDFLNSTYILTDILNLKDIPSTYIILPCDKKMFEQLVDFKYHLLLEKIIKGITLEKESLEIYTSEMEEDLVLFYIDYVTSIREKTVVKTNPKNNSFEIHTSKLFLNIVISAFSQLHTELTAQLEYFNKLIEINSKYAPTENYTENLFINSKVPTAYSYFVIAFIAENLNIKLKL